MHEQKWTDPCMSIKKKGGQNQKKRRMHVHEQKRMDTKKKKKKKFDDEVTLNHVGKSTIQSRQTKYHKNGTLIEDYNASQRLKVRAAHVSGAVYQWPTMQKNVQSYV